MIDYIALTSLSLLTIALAGIVTSRHLVLMIISVQLIFIASSMLLISFAAQASTPGPDAVTMLIGIWAVSAAETITFVMFYLCIKMRGSDMDLATLSKSK